MLVQKSCNFDKKMQNELKGEMRQEIQLTTIFHFF